MPLGTFALQPRALRSDVGGRADGVEGLRMEVEAMREAAEHELARMRQRSAEQFHELRLENEALREANEHLAGVEARALEGLQSGVLATLDERNRTVATIEAQLASLRVEHEKQREGVLATLDERNRAVETLESQLSSMQSQLMTVLQAQLQQRDDVRKLASSGGGLQAAPLSLDEVEPSLLAPIVQPSSSRLVGSRATLRFGELTEQRGVLERRLARPRRSIAQEFAQNEGGMWAREYEYVVNGAAREVCHRRQEWQVGASRGAGDAAADMVTRDEGHDGWTLADFCSRPLAKAAGLTLPEVAMLRLYTGPAHAPLQFFLRTSGGEVATCSGRPYHVHFAGQARSPAHELFELDLPHRAATGAERCARCRRSRREHSRQRVHDWSTSVSVLCSAVEKLSMWSPPTAAYRPHREEEGGLPRAFVPSLAEPPRGAADACYDSGFLSATKEKQVALAFSGGRAGHATILEVGFDYASRPADLQWVSQYPAEAECVFPPCTALAPQAARQWSDRRRVVIVHATPASLRVRTEAIAALDSDPSGAVHALASRVGQGMCELGGELSSSVSRLWSRGAGAARPAEPPPPPRSPPQAPAAFAAAHAAPADARRPPESWQQAGAAVGGGGGRMAMREELAAQFHLREQQQQQQQPPPQQQAWLNGTEAAVGSPDPSGDDAHRRAILTINDALAHLPADAVIGAPAGTTAKQPAKQQRRRDGSGSYYSKAAAGDNGAAAASVRPGGSKGPRPRRTRQVLH